MSHSPFSSDPQFDDLLLAITDALLAEDVTRVDSFTDELVGKFSVPRNDAEGLVYIMQRLQAALTLVQPSRRFSNKLKQDLMASVAGNTNAAENLNVVTRIRHLPTRVQIAAGVALLAGFILVSRRRAAEAALPEGTEAPVLQ